MDVDINPRAAAEDLTAKARIRNAALDLFAAVGEDRASMRMVATQAGVTVGLVAHHFTTKENLRDAVEALVVTYFSTAIAGASTEGSNTEIASAKNQAVKHMLATHPTVVNYMRRVLLEPGGPRGQLLERLTELASESITDMREKGHASTTRSRSVQVVALMVGQLGDLFLQPMVDSMWHMVEGDSPQGDLEFAPKVSVSLET